MHEGKRPGGLTALAVLNFVGAGIDAFILAAIVALAVYGGDIADQLERDAKANAARRARAAGSDPGAAQIAPEERDAIAQLRAYESVEPLGVGLQAAGRFACGGLLVAAGVGYLRQRRWGRLVGNIYVIVSLASAVHEMMAVPPDYGGGFRFATLVSLLYPALTIFFINGTFREDLSR